MDTIARSVDVNDGSDRPLGQCESAKRCRTCQTVQPSDEFYRSRTGKFGRSSHCKECTRVRSRAARAADPDRFRAAGRATYHRSRTAGALKSGRDAQAVKASARAATQASRERLQKENPADFRARKFLYARRAKAAPDVTKEYLVEMFRSASVCPCCGKKLYLGYRPRPSSRFRGDPDAPSIDRVNNAKGYTRNNIAIICWECNFRKNDMSLAHLRQLVAYMEQFGDYSGDAS